MRLLYLHGFRSSPLSTKAQTMARRVAAHNATSPAEQRIQWHCPQLPPSPARAMADIMQWVDTGAGAPEALAVIGSSLGGFYAALVAQATGCRCVLLNPAVYPARDLQAHIGRVTNWHDEGGYEFTQQHVDELQAIQTTVFTQSERYMAIVSKGDEVLDWREMVARYPTGRMLLQEGSDHAISEFGVYVEEVFAFVQRSSTSAIATL
jgi:predicted esterase YcpF (UPF0227 family)